MCERSLWEAGCYVWECELQVGCLRDLCEKQGAMCESVSCKWKCVRDLSEKQGAVCESELQVECVRDLWEAGAATCMCESCPTTHSPPGSPEDP